MTAILKALLNILITAVAGSLGGIQGWIVGKILKYGGQDLIVTITNAWASMKRSLIQKQAEKKDEVIINDPSSTVDEKGKAYEDMFNSGRKP